MGCTAESNGDTHFEKIARTRWGSYLSHVEMRGILKAHDLSSGPATALDVGCDGGRWAKLLADRGWRMICLDINEEALSLCKMRMPESDCILVKAEDTSLPCESNSVSLLLCMEVPYVLSSSRFIDEARRVLKSGKLMVGVFNNLLSWRGLLLHAKSSLTGSYDYYRYCYPAWKDELRKKGLDIIYEEGFAWFPFTRSSNSALIPFFTGLERTLRLHRLPSVSPWVVFIARSQ